MSRLSRKNRTDIKYVSGMMGPFDLFDNDIKMIYRISDEEYNYIAKNGSDELLNLILSDKLTFSQNKILLSGIDKLIEEYKESC